MEKVKIKAIILCFFLILVLFSNINIVISENTENETASNSMKLRYFFDIPDLKKIKISDEYYTCLESNNFEQIGEAGDPQIPIFGCKILLPYEEKFENIELEKNNIKNLEIEHPIIPGQKPYPISSNQIIEFSYPNVSIYSKDFFYPEKDFEIVGLQRFRGYNILIVNLYPVKYNPKENILSCSQSINIKINTKKISTGQKSDFHQNFRGLQKDIDSIVKKVDNPENVGSYPGPFPTHTYEHVIITTNAMKCYTGQYNFQALRDKRISQGLNSKIVTTEYITSNYPGSTTQLKIRNFIKYAYNNWDTEYILLGGDDNLVPAQIVHVDDYQSTDMPSDLYYSCLDDPAPSGESTDDLFAEVYVGRACIGNTQELSNFVKKTLGYIESDDDSYLEKILWAGEHLGFGGVSEYAAWMKEQNIGYCDEDRYITCGQPEEGFNIDRLYARDTSWGKNTIMNKINNNVHLINHLGHANYGYSMKMYNSDIADLTNNKYFFAYSQGCNSGGFDHQDCAAEYFTVKTDHAAFAVVMNARFGWCMHDSTNGPSNRYDREFWDAIYGERILRFGVANQDSREDNYYRISYSCMTWCYYQLNFLGDPATKLNIDLPELEYSPKSYDFGYLAHDSTHSSTFQIWNSKPNTELHYTLESNKEWLTISPDFGISAGEYDTITITADTTNLQTGRYNAVIQINSNGGYDFFNVTLFVGPELGLSHKSYDFGAKNEGDTDSFMLEIWNKGAETLNYELSEYYSWIDIEPENGKSTGEHDQILISVDTTDLKNGSYQCTVLISTNAQDAILPVTLTVGAAMNLSPPSFAMTKKDLLSGKEISTSFEVWNEGIDTLNYNIQADCEWMQIEPLNGYSNGEKDTIEIDFDENLLYNEFQKGLRRWNILINSNGGINVFTINIFESMVTNATPPSIPDKPINPHPEDGSTINNDNQELEITVNEPENLMMTTYFYDHDTGYLLGIDPNLNGPCTASTTWENLQNGREYRWYAIAKNTRDATSKSNIFRFNTIFTNQPPYEPNDPYPHDGETNVNTTPKLSWDGGDPDPKDTVTYDIYFGTQNNPPIIETNYQKTNYNNLPTLNYNKTYYWKIKSKDDKGHDTVSEIWSFKTQKNTENNPPNKPSNPTPANNTHNIEIDTIISWNCSDPDPQDTITYDLYLSKNPEPALYIEDLLQTNFYADNLQKNTTYYWKIVAKDSYGLTNHSNIWIFKTKQENNTIPDLKINIEKANIRVLTFILTNNEIKNLTLLNWSIFIRGGFFGLINTYNNGTIEQINQKSTKQIYTDIKRFGFGIVDITILVDINNNETLRKTYIGLILGKMIYILE